MAAADSIRETLTAKVGGIPTWAWGLGVGGAVLAFMAYRERGRNVETEGESPEPTPTTSGDPVTGGGSGPFTMTPSTFGGGSWAVAPTTGESTDDEEDPTSDPRGFTTNEEWRRTVIDWAIGVNFNPITASEAVGKYLSGEPMTSEEIAVIQSILRQFGAPPQGAPSIIKVPTKPVNKPPAPKPTPTPTPTKPAPSGARRYYSYEWRHVARGRQYAQRQDLPVESSPPAGWLAAKAAGRTAKRFGPKTTTTLTLPGKVSTYEVARSSYE